VHIIPQNPEKSSLKVVKTAKEFFGGLRFLSICFCFSVIKAVFSAFTVHKKKEQEC